MAHSHMTGPARGFTLIEVMVALAIIAILAGVAVPAFDSLILNTRLRSYANTFYSSVQLARSEAKKRNATVTLCMSSDGSTCTTSGDWDQGWIILSGSQVILQQPALASGYRLSSTESSLSFQSSGFGATIATLTLCRHTPFNGQGRSLQVSMTGRVVVSRSVVETCS